MPFASIPPAFFAFMIVFNRHLLLLLVVLLAGPVYAQRVAESPEQAFSDAYKLYADEFYEQAIAGFDAFQEAYPDHVNAAEALYYQAEASLAVGHTDLAVTLFTRFRRQYPAHPLAFRASLAPGRLHLDRTLPSTRPPTPSSSQRRSTLPYRGRRT